MIMNSDNTTDEELSAELTRIANEVLGVNPGLTRASLVNRLSIAFEAYGLPLDKESVDGIVTAKYGEDYS